MAACTVNDVVHELHPTLLAQMREHYDQAHELDSSALDFNSTIEAHIIKAQSFAEASLSRVYKMPIKSMATRVISPVCKIAAYYAAAAFGEKEEILIDKYRTAVQQLDWLVAADDPSLIDEAANVSAFSGVRWGSDERVFTKEELEKW